MVPKLTRRGRGLRVVSIDLEPDLPRPPAPVLEGGAYVIGRYHGRPVGRRVLHGRGAVRVRAQISELARSAEEAIGIAEREAEAGLAGVPTAAEIGVVIATRNRPRELRDALAALRRLDPPPGAIVVADSASGDAEGTGAAAREARARLVRCDRPGLSLARNTGAAASGTPFVAFLDDDCRVDASWLDGIRRGFEDDRVAIVTGGFAPAELDTPAQLLFLRLAHMERRGFVPRRFSRDDAPSRHWPLDAWRMGSGGNMAVRRSVFEASGGFRLDLGLGTPARGGEDLFFLFDAIRSGWDVVYRPDAMVFHRHHRELSSLRRVMSGYGAGLRAYLRATAEAGWDRRRIGAYLASFAYDRTKRLGSAAAHVDPRRAGLVLREVAGAVARLPRGTP